MYPEGTEEEQQVDSELDEEELLSPNKLVINDVPDDLLLVNLAVGQSNHVGYHVGQLVLVEMQLANALDILHAICLLQPHQLQSQNVLFEVYPLGLHHEVISFVVIFCIYHVECELLLRGLLLVHLPHLFSTMLPSEHL